MSYNVLLGGAIGDALGVPFETKKSTDPFLVNWDGESFLGSEYHKLKPGQWSDDSQMQQIVANSLISCKGFDPNDLSKRYIDWFYYGSPRGFGKTTKAAIENLKNGIHWSKSGIEGSYGNGTAMRAAPLGIYFKDDLRALIEACSIDAYITHASIEAKAGSIAIALTIAAAANNQLSEIFNLFHEYVPNSVVGDILQILPLLLRSDIDSKIVLNILGTKADVKQTVPAALYCFLKHDSFERGVITAIKSGGDTDTTASIVGGLYGAMQSIVIPKKWIFGVENSKQIQQLDRKLNQS